MGIWKQIAVIGLAWMASSCSVEDTFQPIDGADTAVIATDLQDGKWLIEFVFAEPQPGLFFSRSKGDYRTETWTPVADAPKIERVGGFDAILFEEPKARFAYEIEPYSQGIPQDYTPFLAFTDGGTALFTGQFELLTISGRDELSGLGGDLNAWTGDQPALGVRVRSERPMLVQGDPVQNQVEHVSTGAGTYVYIGESELFEGKSFIGVIDKALPAHLRESLDEDLAALFAIYEQRWGFALSNRATIYYAFDGYDRPGYSNKGSVLGIDLMVLQSSGEGLREPDPDNRLRNLWFFAHEAAHMFQGNVMASFQVGPDAWIHEGGANTMAYSAIQSLPGVPESFIIDEYASAFEKCSNDLAQGPLTTAHIDGRFYAHYHCGQLFNAAAAAALPDYDLYSFWRAFTDDLDPEDGNPAETFLDTLGELGADPEIAALIHALANDKTETPRRDLARLLSLSGLEPEFDENDGLVSINVSD